MTTTTAVRIWCPDWCTVSEQTHLADLDGWEGLVIHNSDDFGLVSGEDYAMTSIAHPDGTPQPEHLDADVMCMAGNGELVHPDDMERHAQALLAMVARARSERKERSL